MKIKLLYAFLFLFIGVGQAQDLNESSSILMMKANVLFESGRYDEAVRMYNRILNDDRSMTRALIMRGKAKYELGAYRGTKNDIMDFIESDGVTKEVIHLMAKTELKLGNLTAADNYATTAVAMDPYNSELILLSGDIAREGNDKGRACRNYDLAAALGSTKAKYRVDEHCNGIRRTPDISVIDNSTKPAPKEEKASTEEEKAPEVQADKEEKKDGEIVSLEDIVKEAEDNLPPTEPTKTDDRSTSSYPIDRDAVQSIKIDNKLYIDITNGLGTRKLDYKPSIFMLSDQDGIVVIDLCVDADGDVTDASFNREKSTIFRSSLTSLALRKARSFEFVRDNIAEQCGSLVFNIKS